MRKDLARNLSKIINCLKEAEEGWLWYREIERRTGLHHKTIARLIEKHLSIFVDIQPMEPFNLKMIRLKPNIDLNAVTKFIKLKEKIENFK